MHRHKTFFACGSSVQWEKLTQQTKETKNYVYQNNSHSTQWDFSVKVVQLLGLQGPWQPQVCRETDCLHPRSYAPIRVFFQASCSWWSEGLLGQFFSIALPIQALRRLPCLGSFNITVIQVYAPTTNAEAEPLRSWSWMVLWRPTRPLRTNIKKRCPFHHRGLECKSRKSRDT